jgi:hypothetical protein
MKSKEDLLDDVDKATIDRILDAKRKENEINKKILEYNKQFSDFGVQITGMVYEEGPISQKFVNFEKWTGDPRRSIIDIEKKIEQLKIEQADTIEKLRLAPVGTSQQQELIKAECVAGFGIMLLEWVIGKGGEKKEEV